MKKLTMKDIGILANVSQSTVSRVLSNHPNVKKEVRERVLKCIEENEFSPDINAKIMRGESAKILGFVSAGFDNPYYLEMVGFVEREARRRGYSVIVMNSEDDEDLEKYHFKELMTRHVDGIVSAPVSLKNLKFLKNNKFPFIVLNENIDWVDSFYTVLANGGKEVAKYFKEKKFTKVGYIGENRSEKYRGFLEEINSDRIINNIEDNVTFGLEKDLRKVIKREVKKINLDCEAFFFSSDTIAFIFLEEAEKLGISLEGKTLVAFDNTIISKVLKISSVEQPMEHLVEKGLDLLLEKVKKNIKLEEVYNIGLDPKLIIR
ncbi:LacI family DNA-binding transcriptional regulator [uncultured Fusobacterium sp.]|jgi:DNA-binding LacI/PurR family transcriptional regulator|uniref:LacI family DNA-binding transcriptional regulator n=1 Tax=uncultured Fusobacterium sp. TaxID=159267 RepID=UPI0025CC7500|nr:LacI family DNA-binding transcriptional regulator [uncultured Fusobacterium sp.]MCF2639538.1 LacI family DNA-binding transcriptional regulator [Fusobacterium varium]